MVFNHLLFNRISSLFRRTRHSPETSGKPVTKLNLGSGSRKLNGYCNIDVSSHADLQLDLERESLPFPDESIDTVVCISAINYFTRDRALEIIYDVFRVLKPGGVARFAVQDLRKIAKKYVERDRDFFFQKLADGRERFEGDTMADKFNAWFYGYRTSQGKHCKYFYDFESLALLFRKAGFVKIEEKKYRESRIPNIKDIDNRPEQMFFLEAVK
ncbi:MAG: hypothetical protein A3F04_01995 [Candidatus Chisholmbacteria bacterium RIFCSPHIGHO2_12_FULL_49_9]|uniref:Methyltransferase type 11 domain-containing protein n=1 Tax=Candidatus Chisholmbacteria bacterium RIFCSPHIGHO2_01_FULL_52_32 TaxID=1797591 RepID=A0A1G1VSX1_9BACT|nr:MAG: hypothetical protein A2786_03325 [Candidatus Chisholmbacteria bacterium RIFCSPHIGHO2_01_FULL_52_32]OGY19205.1 MAG: hypothetical protein A3F04_01995 [Candidatus Chisholmbacteria bacterium RIFCSPHIGHO2_12_FULL_49_9]OGY20126.1 MAG: hypothetical protein A2900_03420 [Candidatus Chisholmbacteria bacterium RIFCSPLOWO2_01_FULL_50_28]